MATILLSAGTTAAFGEDLPLWEAGIGATVIGFPDYLGSDQYNVWPLPFPYFVYRGDFLTVDRDAISGQLLETPRFNIKVSASGALPVDSDDNDARRGMDDLDPVVEIGPSLQYTLFQTADRYGDLLIDLPIRAAATVTHKRIDGIGWTANPRLRYIHDQPWQGGRLHFDASIGPFYGNDRYHDYFYAVDEEFARPDRPTYDPDGGYGGWRLSLGFSHRVGQWWYGGFVRYFDLNDAEYADSPLIERRDALFGGVAFAWVFAESSRPGQRR